ncbi:MAG: hypothetical protein U1F51_21705 [Burkholderiales bacterium]
MHIVILAWLFVIGTMSLTMGVLAGIAFFAVAGAAPVALYAALKLLRMRRRPAPGSVREEGVDQRDHADAGADQR